MTVKPGSAKYRLIVCCVCGEPATILDTEYDEAWCDTHAREYEVMDSSYWRSLEEDE